MPTYIVKNILLRIPFQKEFFIEIISNLMVYSHMITLAMVGSKVINVSRETSILAYGLKSNVGELVWFMAHHKLEMRVFDMMTVNLESFFMTVTSLMAYAVFLVQYGLSTEESRLDSHLHK
jgi:hypothetical protein